MSKKRERSGEYEIGYKKPPKKHQFKKGQSGNPRGRPSETIDDPIDVAGFLSHPMSIPHDGTAKEITPFEAGLRKLVGRAIKEMHLNSILEILRLCDAHDLFAELPGARTSGVLVVPYDYEIDEFLQLLEHFGHVPPWPGPKSGVPVGGRERLGIEEKND